MEQREIKFRAWDSRFNDMITGDDFCMTLDGQKILSQDDENANCRSGNVGWGFDGYTDKFIDRFILMQYTGLKDKNDKEIYDGDIIKETFPDDYYSITVVEYKEQCDDGASYLGYEMFGKTAEIIGNIYENPELLELKYWCNKCKNLYKLEDYSEKDFMCKKCLTKQKK